MNINDAIAKLTSWFNALVTLGFALIGLFLVVDILFPGSTGIVANVQTLVNAFTAGGLTGLIALIFFAAILKW